MGAQIGHVHLKVSNLARSVKFYEEALGLEVQQMMGDTAAFLSFDGYHHHLGLNVWHSRDASPSPVRATGLYHFAILYPSRRELAIAVKRVIEYGVNLTGASHHGVSEAVYFNDPDENGCELYWDLPPKLWPRVDGKIAMVTDRLDLSDLLSLAE